MNERCKAAVNTETVSNGGKVKKTAFNRGKVKSSSSHRDSEQWRKCEKDGV